MNNKLKNDIFTTIKENNADSARDLLADQDLSDPALLMYAMKHGKTGSFLSFCVKEKAWLVFDYLISLPCIQHVPPQDFYKNHAIWLFHARSSRAIEALFLLENSPLNIESFYRYFFNNDVFQKANAHLVELLSSLGYPSDEWHKHKWLKNFKREIHSVQSAALINACLYYKQYDDAVNLMMLSKTMRLKNFTKMCEHELFSDNNKSLCQQIQLAFKSGALTLGELDVNALRSRNTKQVLYFLQNVIHPQGVDDNITVLANYACCGAEKSLLREVFTALLAKVSYKTLIDALMKINQPLLYINETLSFFPSNLDNDIYCTLFQAQKQLLIKQTQLELDTELCPSNIEMIFSNAYSDSQYVALTRYFYHYYPVNEFACYIKPIDHIKTLIRIGASPIDIIPHLSNPEDCAEILATYNA